MSGRGQDEWFDENAFVPEGSAQQGTAPVRKNSKNTAPAGEEPKKEKHGFFSGLFKVCHPLRKAGKKKPQK